MAARSGSWRRRGLLGRSSGRQPEAAAEDRLDIAFVGLAAGAVVSM